MESKKGTLSLALLLLAAALPLAVATADTTAQSAEGSVRISADVFKGAIEFRAAVGEDGVSTGRMTFRVAAGVREQDVDGAGGYGAGVPSPDLSFGVDVDCLEVVRQRAVMGGIITDSTRADYVGRRVLLVVVDNGNGESPASRDGFAWGVYKQGEKNWMASDAEAEYDPGAGASWVATDAERQDDAGEPSHKSEQVNCKSFPLQSFSLIEVKQEEGNILIRR